MWFSLGITFTRNVLNCSSSIIPGKINLLMFKSILFMNASDIVWMFSVYKLPLLFKLSLSGRCCHLSLLQGWGPVRQVMKPFLMELGKGQGIDYGSLGTMWRLLPWWGSTENRTWLQIFPLPAEELSILPLLVKIKLFASGEGWERRFILSLSLFPGHRIVSNIAHSLTDTFSTKLSWQTFSYPILGLLWQNVGATYLEMFRIWESLLEKRCGMKKAKGGWEDPTVLFPRWETDLCRHNFQEQKLWVRNVERSLREGNSAFKCP